MESSLHFVSKRCLGGGTSAPGLGSEHERKQPPSLCLPQASLRMDTRRVA